MSGHGLVRSTMLLGVLFQEREVGGCEVPAKTGISGLASPGAGRTSIDLQ